LYKGADLIRDVEFVIFDEVHYVNDAEVSDVSVRLFYYAQKLIERCGLGRSYYHASVPRKYHSSVCYGTEYQGIC
jgi:antiviral helicase SKI2